MLLVVKVVADINMGIYSLFLLFSPFFNKLSVQVLATPSRVAIATLWTIGKRSLAFLKELGHILGNALVR